MIRDFIAEVKQRGMARTNRYVVYIPFINTTESSLLKLFCSNASIPGISFATTEQRIFGEVREMPYNRIFEPASFTFYVDTDLIVKSAFDKWTNSIMDFENRTLNYYTNYVMDVDVEIHDLQDNTSYNITLFEAYPKTVSSIELSSDSRDVMKLTVQMMYKYWQPSTVFSGGKASSTSLNDGMGVTTGQVTGLNLPFTPRIPTPSMSSMNPLITDLNYGGQGYPQVDDWSSYDISNTAMVP